MKQIDFRTSRGLSRAQFAALIGVSEVTVWRYENGRIPQWDVLKMIIDVTDGAVGFEDYVGQAEGAA